MEFFKCFIFVLIYCPFVISVIGAALSQIKTNNDVLIEPAQEDKLMLQDQHYWKRIGEEQLKRILKQENPKHKVAKNVIIFVGDGMGMTTTTATRIYKGQHTGAIGEEHSLSFDQFPNVALLKTYNVDMQVPDSAGTATALFTGVKTRMHAIGLDVLSDINNFDETIYNKSKLSSIMDWAQKAGKSTGFVTTTRVTHATPAALYAKINHRDWESDSDVPPTYRNKIKDIARQLVENEPGRNFKVILGGGQWQMGYNKNKRQDNLNLTRQWMDYHKSSKSAFVTNTEQLQNGATRNTEYLLGLFDASHMPYEIIRNKGPEGTPSLSDMTRAALQVLKKNDNGFVLMVEGGLIDQAHHKNYAKLAISETAELDNAVSVALSETGTETLILVTSDHSHSVTMNGYAKRGNDILGFGNETMDETIPYLTVAYANGPGYQYHYQPTNQHLNSTPWRDISRTTENLHDPWYQHLATFFREDETHSGEDVPLYAIGAGSHLVKGVIEQNTVADIISYAACIGPQSNLNPYCSNSVSCIPNLRQSMVIVLLLNLALLL